MNHDQQKIEKFHYDGIDVVRKTTKGKFAQLLTAHEVKVLKRLKGISGVQQFIKQDSPTSFLSEFIAGKTLRELEGGDIPEDVFEKLKGIVEEIHRNGVADPDFAHSVDIIITPSGNPIVIDFASSIIYDADSRFKTIIKPLFDYIKVLNKKYLIKRKARYLPHLMNESERNEAQKVGFLPILISFWRNFGRFIKNNPSLGTDTGKIDSVEAVRKRVDKVSQ